jgi:hypothetical protein
VTARALATAIQMMNSWWVGFRFAPLTSGIMAQTPQVI